MQEHWVTIGEVLAGTGLSVAVIMGLIKWFGERWVERIQRKWTERFQTDIESLRADFQIQQGFLQTAASTTSAGYLVAQERRLVAIESLWKTILDIRDATSSALSPYSFLLLDEIENLGPDHEIFAKVPKSFDSFASMYSPMFNELEKCRPFLGERLWLSFFTYRAVALRMVFLMTRGLEKSKVGDWRDNGIFQLLKTVLSEEEIVYLKNQSIGGPQRALELIELKILTESESWISGQNASEASLKAGRKVVEMMGRINILDRR